MGARRNRSREASVEYVWRRMLGRSNEVMWAWSGKLYSVKLALILCFGVSILVIPLSLTFTSTVRQVFIESLLISAGENTTETARTYPDETLEGLLLPPEYFNGTRCSSRSEEHFLRTPSKFRPSPYLISKLRDYERRHRICAQLAVKFNPANNATEQDFGGCQFVVWIPSSGLGNQIMALTSAFVYALLTDRVLLIDRSVDAQDLFCEPFPDTSWLLPKGFRNQWATELGAESACRFGSLARNGTFNPHNGFAFVNLMHDYDDDDRRFFCSRHQACLSSFPWLFLKSNQYFVVGLHFVSEFRVELDKLFPEREALFHHVIRYLIHPSDSVWRMISRFLETKLASAQRKVGLQIREMGKDVKWTTTVDLVLSCVLENKLLPNVTVRSPEQIGEAPQTNSIAVLVASLRGIFYERIRGYYTNHTTPGVHSVGVYTASHEEVQARKSLDHDKKALADMYLLSFSDTLVTSAWSTFGYVAQGISGVTPWILTKLDSSAKAEAAIRSQGHCYIGKSIEPCFHAAPLLDCENNGWGSDTGKILPYVQHCEDVSWGIKITENRTLNAS